MRQGKELILATKPYASERRAESWRHLAVVLALMAGLMSVIVLVPWLLVRIGASVIYALVLARLFIVYHDYLHHALLQRSKVAEAIMTVVGLYMLSPKSIWKRSHDYHHKHNSKLSSADVGSYPVAHTAQYFRMTAKERMGYLAARHPLTILFGYLTVFGFGMLIRPFLNNPKRHADSLLSLVLHVGASALIVWQGSWLMWFLTMAFPFFITFGLGAYLFYAQHNFPGVSFAVDKTDWAYEKAALQSSSYLKTSRLMQWFIGNIGYHHIHHLNARIPFYRLPEAMQGIPELQRAHITTFKLRDIAACLRLRVWDPAQQKMLTMRELASARRRFAVANAKQEQTPA